MGMLRAWALRVNGWSVGRLERKAVSKRLEPDRGARPEGLKSSLSSFHLRQGANFSVLLLYETIVPLFNFTQSASEVPAQSENY